MTASCASGSACIRQRWGSWSPGLSKRDLSRWEAIQSTAVDASSSSRRPA